MLKDKVAYVIVTGANKANEIADFLHILKKHEMRLIVMPTESAISLSNNLQRGNYATRLSSNGDKVPEEDITVVAPCTFNTMSKIANGIADSYPMSILHASIGKGKPVVIAPAMDRQYWEHPLSPHMRDVVSGMGIDIVWPEYLYSSDGLLEKITMAPWGKVFDFVWRKFQKYLYADRCLSNGSIVDDTTYDEFRVAGSILQKCGYVSSTNGFLAKRSLDMVTITRSGAELGRLLKSDLSSVKLNSEGSVIQWVGEYYPSSETPLAIETFRSFSKTQVIVHGHCRHITYSPRMARYQSDDYLQSSAWGELRKLLPQLRKWGCGIMKLHGELIMATDFASAIDRYRLLNQEVSS